MYCSCTQGYNRVVPIIILVYLCYTYTHGAHLAAIGGLDDWNNDLHKQISRPVPNITFQGYTPSQFT